MEDISKGFYTLYRAATGRNKSVWLHNGSDDASQPHTPRHYRVSCIMPGFSWLKKTDLRCGSRWHCSIESLLESFLHPSCWPPGSFQGSHIIHSFLVINRASLPIVGRPAGCMERGRGSFLGLCIPQFYSVPHKRPQHSPWKILGVTCAILYNSLLLSPPNGAITAQVQVAYLCGSVGKHVMVYGFPSILQWPLGFFCVSLTSLQTPLPKKGGYHVSR